MNPEIRDARPEEAAEIAALIRASITGLCARDHRNEPDALAAWLANKTPEAVAGWIAAPDQRLIVARETGRLAGTAAARPSGDLLLLYVAPDAVGRGIGAGLLAALEAWLRREGAHEIRLESTVTARDFYRARGYRETGSPAQGGATGCLPMAKPLGHAPTALVIFDCDGVLVDSEPIALRLLIETLAAAGLGLEPDEVHTRFLGRSLATTREILAADYGLTLGEDALAGMRHRLYAAFRAELRPIPHIAEALDALPCPFCVASSSQPERIELSLTVTGLWPRFAGRAFSATMVARGKPAPDLFLHAAASLGYTPGACLVVEDSPAGVTAARSAGMRVVAFTGGSHATSDCHRAGIAALEPDAIIDDMRDLPELAAG